MNESTPEWLRLKRELQSLLKSAWDEIGYLTDRVQKLEKRLRRIEKRIDKLDK